MSLPKSMVTFLLVSLKLSWGFAQQFDVLPAATQLAPPTEAVATVALATAANEIATRGELVSNLKRRLTASDQHVQIKCAPEWFQNMMQKIVRENVPHKYVYDKDWGKIGYRWNGVRLGREGLRLSTKRKWKEVNHGTWKRYEIRQVDPTKNLFMRIENVHNSRSGKIGFEVSLTSKLQVFGHTSKWVKGLRIYSVSAEADADVQLKLWCEIGMRLNFRKFPPDVWFVPEVTRGDLNLTSFQLRRVSKFDGPVIRQLSESVHKLLRAKIEEKRDRLPEKINRQIARNEDKLRLSITDFTIQKWRSLTTVSGVAVEQEQSSTTIEVSREAQIQPSAAASH